MTTSPQITFGSFQDPVFRMRLRGNDDEALHLERDVDGATEPESVMTFTKTGRVGINAGVPGATLHVRSFDDPDQADVYLGRGGDADETGYSLHKNAEGDLEIRRRENDDEAVVMRFASDGRVGVNVSAEEHTAMNAPERFTVKGDAVHDGALTVGDRQRLDGRGRIRLRNGGTVDNDDWGLYVAPSGDGNSLDGGAAPAGYDFAGDALRARVSAAEASGLVLENAANERLMSVRGSDGLTRFEGPVQFPGGLDLGSNLRLNRIEFPGGDTPYVLDKITGGVGDQHLRLSIPSGGAQESLQIYGDGDMQHKLDAAGNAIHAGSLEVNDGFEVFGTTRLHGNLNVDGTMTTINTDVSSTDQLKISNNGTAPALVVNQLGSTPIAQFQDDGAPVVTIADGGNVGIGGIVDPAERLHVDGDALLTGGVQADKFVGDGQELTNLSANNLSSGNVGVARGGTGASSLTNDKLLVGGGLSAVRAPEELHWDADNKRLGLQTGSDGPQAALDVGGDARVGTDLAVRNDLEVQGNAFLRGQLKVEGAAADVDAPLHCSDRVSLAYDGDGPALRVNRANGEQRPIAHFMADSNVVLAVGADGKLGLNVEAPSERLQVDGNALVSGSVAASSLAGDGSGVTNLNLDNASQGQLGVARGGTGAQTLTTNKMLVGNGTGAVQTPAELHWDATNKRLGVRNTAPTVPFQVTGDAKIDGSLEATSFVGSGASVTDLSADNVASGTLTVARGGTGSASHTAGKFLVGNGTGAVLKPDLLHWDDANSRLGVRKTSPDEALDVVGGGQFTGPVQAASFTGDGSNLTNISLDNVTTGTLPVDQGGTGSSSHSVNKVVVGDGTNALKTPTDLHWDDTNQRLGVRNTSPDAVLHVSGDAIVSNSLSASSLSGNGASVTDLNADNVTSGLLEVVYGGTGKLSHTANKVLVGDDLNPIKAPSDLHWDSINNRLGVQTSSPSEALHVIGNAQVSGIVSASAVAGDGSSLTALNADNVASGTLTVPRGGTGSASHPAGKFLVGDGSSALLRPADLHWDAAAGGRLGIKTDAPAGALDVHGDVYARSNLDVYGTTHLHSDLVVDGTFTTLETDVQNTEQLTVGNDGSATALLVNQTGGQPIAKFQDNSNAAVTFADGGRVGIGTDFPSQKLHVEGGGAFLTGGVEAASFSGVGSDLTQLNVDNVSSGTLDVSRGGTGKTSHTADKILVGAGDNALRTPSDLHWDVTNSRLGLRTTSPSSTLDVVGDAMVSGSVDASSFVGNGASLTSLNADAITTGSLDVSRGGTGNTALTANKLLLGNDSGPVLAPVSLHYNTSNQRLGVKTSDPQQALDVVGNGRFSGSVEADTLLGDGSGVTALDANNVASGTLDVGFGGTGAGSHGQNKLLVGRGTDAVLSPADLHWDADSNLLGIGTVTPAAKLDVNGAAFVQSNLEVFENARVHGDLTIDGTLNTIDTEVQLTDQLTVTNDGTKTAMIVNQIGNMPIAEFMDDSNVELYVGNNGLIGIGTDAPQAKLDVQGGDAIISGSVSALSFSGDGSNLTNISLDNVTTGTLPVSQGGTNTSDLAAGKVMVGNGSNAVLSPGDLHWDGSNVRLGVRTATPSEALDVDGNARVTGSLSAASLAGDGSNITNLSLSQITGSGTLPVELGGTGTDSHTAGKLLVGDGSNAVLSPAGLHWDASSNFLGVSTSTPTAPLDVAGAAKIGGPLTAVSFSGDGSNLTDLSADAITAGVLDVTLGGTGSSNLPSGGLLIGSGTNPVTTTNDLIWDDVEKRLGVNTATPSEALHVTGNALATGSVSAASFSGDGSNLNSLDANKIQTGVLDVAHGGTGSSDLSAGSLLVGAGSNAAVLSPADLHWDASSNFLGVNTSTPEAALHVVGDVKTSSNVTAASFTGDGSNITNLDLGNVTAGTLPVDLGGTGTSNLATGSLLVGAGSNAVLTPSGLHWDAGSNLLGVNKASPGATLDVAGDGGFAGVLRVTDGNSDSTIDAFGSTADRGSVLVQDAADATKRVALGWDGANDVAAMQSWMEGDAGRQLWLNPAGGVVQLGQVGSGGGAMFVNANGGNVGIDQSAPTYKLHVNGDVYTSGELTTMSDARVKSDLRALSDGGGGALDRVGRLRGWTFKRSDLTAEDKRRKSDGGVEHGEDHIGFLAQELREVVPEVVSYDRAADRYSVNYGNITALLAEAVKELSAREAATRGLLSDAFKSLERRVAALETTAPPT